MANLILETKNYQAFDLQYGIILVNKNPDRDFEITSFATVFMQGDDSLEFSMEVALVNSNQTKTNFIDNWLSEYDNIMTDYLSKNELSNLGVNVRASRNSKKIK